MSIRRFYFFEPRLLGPRLSAFTAMIPLLVISLFSGVLEADEQQDAASAIAEGSTKPAANFAEPAVADHSPQNSDVAAVAAQIDALFETYWQQEQVTPSVVTTDEEYLRRLYLDLAGRIPAVSEIRRFLNDDDPEKRLKEVDRLLDRPSSVRHFTTILRSALLPPASSQPQFRGFIPGFEAWLWKHISENRPYDEIARAIISTPLTNDGGPALTTPTGPDAFYITRELKPENLATGTARAFLGVRLDCAQCHDHPFDKWKQQQFWNLAAFYSGFDQPNADEDSPVMMTAFSEKTNARSIGIPGLDETVPAMFLNGQTPDWQQTANQSTRQVLADWITSPENPWFAKMAVNRLWAQFLGRGIVDPVDDFSENNPASHPEVLELLAADLVAHDYNLQRTVRVITATRVYQLSSVRTDETQEDPIHFARAALRGLSPEQLFDSLAEAVGFYQPFRSDNPFAIDTDSPRAGFLELFQDSAESPLDRETTILQALAMMNGEFITDATSLEDSRTLRAVVDFPGMSTKQKLHTLFLATLSRSPTAAEEQRFLDYLKSGGAVGDTEAAYTDIYWALLNSSEFLLNH